MFRTHGPGGRRLLPPTLARYASAFRSWRGATGGIILLVLTLAAILAPVLYPGGPDQQSRNALVAPSWAHPFGLDEVGRDIFARAIYGLGIDLSLIFLAVPAAVIGGLFLGLSGIVSEPLGNAMQRLLDLIYGFPTLVLGLVLISILGPGWLPLFITIAVCGLPPIGRLARASYLEQRGREYVVAARVLGTSDTRILVRHIIPNALDPVIVQGAIWGVVAIYIEAGLSIVGLGIQPPTPSLGVLLNNGLRFVDMLPSYVLGPTLIVLLLAMALMLIADALNKTVNRG